MKFFYYLTETQEVIRVPAKRRPGPNTMPRPSCLWVVQEHFPLADPSSHRGWHATWEITWGRLSKLRYIGKLAP